MIVSDFVFFRNLINRFSCSCVLRIQIAKFYIGRGRNRETAMEYVRYAIKCNPNHPEANLLAAKYLTGCRDDVSLVELTKYF